VALPEHPAGQVPRVQRAPDARAGAAEGDHLNPPRGVPWLLLVSEAIGTAALLAVGLSIVILVFGAGSPVAAILPNPGLRRLIAGFLFGSTGALIAISPVGKESGAHLNPVVTMSFWLMGNMRHGTVAGYAAAQLAGAVLGSLPLLAWGPLGGSVEFGATTPGAGYGWPMAFAGEAGATFVMILLLLAFVRSRSARRFTPLLFPVLYAVMVFLEAPISGTSTNPARSFGPALVSGVWTGWWVYWAGPLLGGLLAAGAHRLGLFGAVELEVAKLYHFEHDRYRELRHRRTARTVTAPGGPHRSRTNTE
jgi:aquaporin Z